MEKKGCSQKREFQSLYKVQDNRVVLPREIIRTVGLYANSDTYIQKALPALEVAFHNYELFDEQAPLDNRFLQELLNRGYNDLLHLFNYYYLDSNHQVPINRHSAYRLLICSRDMEYIARHNSYASLDHLLKDLSLSILVKGSFLGLLYNFQKKGEREEESVGVARIVSNNYDFDFNFTGIRKATYSENEKNHNTFDIVQDCWSAERKYVANHVDPELGYATQEFV